MGCFGAAGGEIQGIEEGMRGGNEPCGAKKEGCRLEAAALGEGWFLEQGERCWICRLLLCCRRGC